MKKPKVTSADCVKCGLCCTAPHDQDAFCDVTSADSKRLGKRFVRLHVLQAHPSALPDKYKKAIEKQYEEAYMNAAISAAKELAEAKANEDIDAILKGVLK